MEQEFLTPLSTLKMDLIGSAWLGLFRLLHGVQMGLFILMDRPLEALVQFLRRTKLRLHLGLPVEEFGLDKHQVRGLAVETRQQTRRQQRRYLALVKFT